MRSGFLPVRDLDLLNWSRNLARELTAHPATYGVSPDDAARFASAQAAFAAAMLRVDPANRSRVTVAAKDDARRALENEARRMNALVRGAGLVNSEALTRLGLTVYKTHYRRIGPPTDSPFIFVRSVIGRRIALRLQSRDTSARGLPPDVTGAALFQWIGSEPPSDVSRWTLVAHATRANFTVEVDAPPGTPVSFCAYYLNRRGERGPMGPTACTFAMGGMKVPSLMAA